MDRSIKNVRIAV